MESSKEKRAKKRKELPVKQRKQDDELVAQEEPDDADASLPMEIDGVESSSCLQLQKKSKKRKRDRGADEITQTASPTKKQRLLSEAVAEDVGSFPSKKRKKHTKKKPVDVVVVEEQDQGQEIFDSDDEQVVEEKKEMIKKNSSVKRKGDSPVYIWTVEQDSFLLQFLISQCELNPKIRKYSEYNWTKFHLKGVSQEQALKRAEHIKGHIRMTKTQLEVLNEAKGMLAEDPNAFSYLGGRRLKKGKIKRLYDEPVMPTSGYMIFSKEKGAKLREKNPGRDLQFYGRTLGEMWRSMESKKKMKYLKQADEARKQYDKEYEEFIDRHPELKDKKTSRAPGRLRPLDAPLKARSAFNFFCDEYRSQLAEGTRREKQKQLMPMFKSASNEEQVRFQEKAAKDKLRYTQELTEYIKQHPEQAELLVEKTGKGGKQKQIPTLPFAMPPKSLYFFFCQRRRKKLISELPPDQKADFNAMSKQLAVEWKTLDQAAKNQLEIKLKKAEKKFQKKLDGYLEGLSEEDRAAFLEKKQREEANKTHVQGHPDIPLDGFKAYSRSKRIEVKGLNPLAKPSKISKDLMDMWVALAYSERLKWKGIEEAAMKLKSLKQSSPSRKQSTEEESLSQKQATKTGGNQLQESDSTESKSADSDDSDKEDQSGKEDSSNDSSSDESSDSSVLLA